MTAPSIATAPVASAGDRERQILAACIVAVALGMATMAAAGHYAFIWKAAVIPALVVAALAVRRLDGFMADWSVFLGLMVLFDFLRGLVFALVTHFELPIYAQYAIDWERWLCGGHVMPVALQQWRADLAHAELLDRFLTLVHSSHFVFFLILGLAVWLFRPQSFQRYATALVLVTYASLLIYLAVPTVPPWMAAERLGVLSGVEHITASIYNSELPSLQKAFDVNPIAAMPSLHAAWPFLGAIVAVHCFGWRGLYAVAYAALALFAIVYLGEHYLVDVVAGAALSAGAYAIAYGRRRAMSVRTSARAAVIAVGLIVTAEAVGMLTLSWARPFEITQSFAERELVGRTPLAHLHLGTLAMRRGDGERARSELAIAAADLPSAAQRHLAAALLIRASAYRGAACVASPEAVCAEGFDRPRGGVAS